VPDSFLFSTDDPRGLWLTRLLLERGIALICLIAFINVVQQFRPLLGEQGLLPVPLFIRQISFSDAPSLFFWLPKDWAFTAGGVLGILLSLLVLTGISSRYSWLSITTWLLIYLLYLSFVNVGQTFYAFGWESILLECCFFAIFLGSAKTIPSPIPIWLFRWLLFRVMFGAGLIKLRGDSCWRDLTCLDYHYETQPMPNPLSWFYHFGPHWLGKAGVLFNHFAELIVPFGLLLPQPIVGIAGLITILFQLSIISSGNLSWLNWLTLILAFSTLDAKFLSGIVHWAPPVMHALPKPVHWSYLGLAALTAWLSVPVVVNMLSARQVMNTNFNSLHLVGTYGAFGSITRIRYEVIVEGTDERVVTSSTRWREYEFKGKPGRVDRMPPQIAPYHLRLDWLMWFAAMSDYSNYPWFVNFVAKLLQGDKPVLSLLRDNPFPQAPPRYVRARLFEYHFTTPAEHRKTGAWWTRREVGPYFPAVSLETPGFRRVLQLQGWLK
jgi:hypothetical protein